MKRVPMRKAALIIVLLAVAAVAAVLFFVSRSDRREGLFFAMGGVPVRIVADGRTKWEFANDQFAVESRVDALENVFSRYRARSEVSQLNDGHEGCIDDVAPALVDVLRQSHRWYDVTAGAFDVTVGPLVDLWRGAAKKGELPKTRDIMQARSRVGMTYLRVGEDNRVCMMKEGMSIDLGGIAKGAILDRAADALRERGVTRGLVDAGGDVVAFGEGVFTIGIQDPLEKEKLLGVLTASAGGIVTSGDYERFVTIEGKRYSHIIDPRSGMPAQSLISVTVIGPNATDADALATALSVMGREKAIDLVRSLKGYSAVMVERDERAEYGVWCSVELNAHIKLAPPWEGALKTF